MSEIIPPHRPESIERYLDREGRLRIYPAKRSNKLLVLAFLAGKFEPERRYREPEINAILAEHHTFGDCALLRRELFDAGFLDRTDDCRTYWLRSDG